MRLADLTVAYNEYLQRYGTTPAELCAHSTVYHFLSQYFIGEPEAESLLFMGVRVRLDDSGMLGEGDFMFGPVPSLREVA